MLPPRSHRPRRCALFSPAVQLLWLLLTRANFNLFQAARRMALGSLAYFRGCFSALGTRRKKEEHWHGTAADGWLLSPAVAAPLDTHALPPLLLLLLVPELNSRRCNHCRLATRHTPPACKGFINIDEQQQAVKERRVVLAEEGNGKKAPSSSEIDQCKC